MNAGDLNVKLTADASGLISNLTKGLESIKKFGNQFKESTQKIAMVGAGITALGAKFAAEGAKYDKNVKGAVDKLGNAYSTLATKISQALIPAIDKVTEFITRLVKAWDSLSGPQKQAISDFAVLAAKVALFIGVVGQIGGLIGTFAGIASSIMALLPAIAIIGVLVVLAAVIWKVWKASGDGLKGTFSGIADTVIKVFNVVVDTISSAMTAVMNFVGKGLEKAINLVKSINGMLPKSMQMDMGPGSIVDTFGEMAKAMSTATVGDVFKASWDGLKESGSFVAEAISEAFAEGKRMMGEVTGLGKLGAAMGGAAPPPLRKLESLDDEEARKKTAADTMAKWIAYNNAQQEALDKAANGVQKMGDNFAADMRKSGLTFDVGALQAGMSEIAAKVRLDMQMGADPTPVVDAWKRTLDAQKDAAEKLKTAAERASAASAEIWGRAISKLGKAGEIVNNAVSAFKDGGIWSAIISVISDLVSETSAFGEVVDLLTEDIKGVVEAISPLLQWFVTLTRASGDLIDAFMPIISEILAVAKVISGLEIIVLVLKLISKAVNMFMPIISLLSGMGLVLRFLAFAMEKIGQAFKWAFQTIQKGILTVLGIIKSAAEWINGAITGVGNWILNLGYVLNSDAVKNVGRGINTLAIGMGGIDDAIKKVTEMTWEDPKKPLNDLASAAQKAAEALTNVPSGYKVAAARFASMADRQGFYDEPAPGASAPVPGASAPTVDVGNRGPRPTETYEGPVMGSGITIHVAGSVVGISDVVTAISRAQRERNFQTSGSNLRALLGVT